MCQVVTRTAVEPHPFALLASDNAEAIMLDFVQPQRPGGWLGGFGRKARCDEADGEGTWTR
jgi:hypothetical protein